MTTGSANPAYIHGDKIGGDKISQDKNTVGDISQESAVAIGDSASVIVNKGYTPEELARIIAEMTRLNQPEDPFADPGAVLLQATMKSVFSNSLRPVTSYSF